MKKNHLIFLFTDSWHLLDFIERKQLQYQGLIQIFFLGGGNYPRNRLFPWIKEQHIHV